MKNCTSSAQLKSLLALSAGAAALPQAADAAIVYSGSLNEQVGFNGGNPSYDLGLPGTAEIRFERGSNTGMYGTANRNVFVYAPLNGGTAQIRGTGGDGVAVTGAGPVFSAVGTASSGGWNVGLREFGNGSFTSGAGTFSNQYMAFRFQDTTQGSANRFGWVELSQVIDISTDPLVTIHGWAYEDSGALIAMGDTGGPVVVPEASSVAMGIFSAMALGGVVAWRKRKAQAQKAEDTAEA